MKKSEKKLQRRSFSKGETVEFSVKQLRNKLKSWHPPLRQLQLC